MAKVTSKLQVTVPRALAERYGIRPGDEIKWEAAGAAVRVVPLASRRIPSIEERLALFDQAQARQRRRERGRPRCPRPRDRGWKRKQLYRRRRAR